MNKEKLRSEFREYLKECDIEKFYNIDLKYIEHRILVAEASKLGNIEQYNIVQILEAVIEPHKIKITTNDIDELNKEFKKYNIIFEQSKSEIKAKYDKENDKIYIIFKENTPFNVLEALIGHEMVHREQHIRAGENYFKQSEKNVKELNDLGKKINSLDMTNANDAKMFPELYKKYNKLKDKFLYLTPYESMAYAYQYVKEFKHLQPKEIFKELEKDKIQINNITKKYIAMYWLIKDKI